MSFTWACRNLADSGVIDRAGPVAVAAEPTANGTSAAAPPQSDAIAALLDLNLDAAAPAEQVRQSKTFCQAVVSTSRNPLVCRSCKATCWIPPE